MVRSSPARGGGGGGYAAEKVIVGEINRYYKGWCLRPTDPRCHILRFPLVVFFGQSGLHDLDVMEYAQGKSAV